MNERKLRIFYEVATRLSMTEAANNLYVTQPAISQAIKELEIEFGVNFFDRIGKKIFLTYEGEIFLRYVRRILNLYNESLQTIKDINGLKLGRLKIGASTTIGIYILTDIIGKFSKKYKNIDISINIENTKVIAEMILDNKIDFGFVEGPVYSDEIVIEDFCSDELVFIASPQHPWAKENTINIENIRSQKIIMREKGSGTREVVENALKSNNIQYSIALELGSTEAIKKAVIAGLGISCLSKRAVIEEVRNYKLSIINIEHLKIVRSLNLIYHRDKYMNNLFKTFIQFAKKEIN